MKISFEIPNKYNSYLSKILHSIDNDDYIWLINDYEIFKKDCLIDLFEKDKYRNKEFKSLISNIKYYIVFANIQLYKNENIDVITDNYLLKISIVDSIYVDIYCKDDLISDKIIKNIKENNFANIKIKMSI